MQESKDILTLFEQLNTHEVFTPPRVARDMLALLPKEIWSNPNVRLLDPATKSGVFLREAMYLFVEGIFGKGKHIGHDGIEYDLNDKKQVVRHVLKNMLFGIATSELTAYIARRTLYGVMRADTDKQTALIEALEKSKNGREWSEKEKVDFITRNQYNDYYDHRLFQTPEYAGFESEGNIFYPNAEVKKIIADEDDYEIEDKYFPFIEDNTQHKKILEIRSGKMKFDVIIGNPPYQVSDGGGVGSSALPIYNKFIESAVTLQPQFMSMIIPSRWFAGGRGLDEFRTKMLNDQRIEVVHDFTDASACFPGVEIKGGVCYFLWNKSKKDRNCKIFTHNKGETKTSTRPLLEDGLDTYIRFNEAMQILRKVKSLNENSFADIVSANDPFGFDVREKGSYKRVKPLFSNSKQKSDDSAFYYNGWRREGLGYMPFSQIRKNQELVKSFKLFIPKAWGVGDMNMDRLTPIVPEYNACCTETYLVVGPFETSDMMLNAKSYIHTKFFHFMVSLIKNTQNTMQKSYTLVPTQDFTQAWSDEALYKKYNLTAEEIQYIEKSIPDSVKAE